MVLSAFFRAEIFYCEAFCIVFEREDVDADGGILFFEERDLLSFHGVDLMLAKPLVACTYLSSIVSELFEPQVQKKITIFTYRSHIFVKLL